MLPDGRIFVAGAITWVCCFANTELYDQPGGFWRPNRSHVGLARISHRDCIAKWQSAHRRWRRELRGRGGTLRSCAGLDSTGALITPRVAHTATLLPRQSARCRWGVSSGYLASAELYNPATGAWSSTGSLVKQPRSAYRHTVVQRKVLVAGGYNAGTLLTSAELYDPATGSWTVTGSLLVARTGHTATLLPKRESPRCRWSGRHDD
jgi:hypothetical protein